MHFQTFLDFIKIIIYVVSHAFYVLFYGFIFVLNVIIVNISCSRLDKTRVRIGRIICKKKLSTSKVASPKDFVCLYLNNVDLNYVLKPNVSLYCVTKNEAIFVEMDSDDYENNCDEDQFCSTIQFTRSTYVIKMPTASFHYLSEKLGDPSIPVMWQSNTGRFGSNVFCQAFGIIPNTLVMSEPDVLWSIFCLKQCGEIADETYRKILRSTVRILCKHRQGVDRIFIRPRIPCLTLMVDLAEAFPTMVNCFYTEISRKS